MRVAVVGSRSFSDYSLLESSLDSLQRIDLIVSGGAKGADSLAELWAVRHGIQKRIFIPDWKRYGRSAGMIRNREIVANADLVIAFWDGKSKGTGHTIEIARRCGVEVQLVLFGGSE